jgi:hypothetical protein
MASCTRALGLAGTLLAAGCGATPQACDVEARAHGGAVAAGFTDDVAVVRELPVVAAGGQLSRLADGQLATVCRIDGTFAKAPPPDENGSIPPNYDRAVIVIVADEAIRVALGYRDTLLLPTRP